MSFRFLHEALNVAARQPDANIRRHGNIESAISGRATLAGNVAFEERSSGSLLHARHRPDIDVAKGGRPSLFKALCRSWNANYDFIETHYRNFLC